MDDSTGSLHTDHEPSHRCAECGAAVTYVPGTRMLQCSRWEGHRTEIVSAARQLRRHPYAVSGQQVEPDGVVPFVVDRQTASATLREWLRSRRFAPRQLTTAARPESLESVYLPHWVFGARTSSDYTGRRGKHHWTTETRTSTDAQGNTTTTSHPVQHTAWKHTDGTVTRDFDDLVVLATGQLDAGQVAKVAPWPLPEALPYQPEYGYGHRRLSCDVALDDGLTRAKSAMRAAIEQDCRQDIGGDAQRVESVDTTYTDVTYRLLLYPLWLLSYRHRDRDREVLINGHTGAVHGTRPYSAAKILGAVAAVAAVLAAIVAAIMLARPA